MFAAKASLRSRDSHATCLFCRTTKHETSAAPLYACVSDPARSCHPENQNIQKLQGSIDPFGKGRKWMRLVEKMGSEAF